MLTRHRAVVRGPDQHLPHHLRQRRRAEGHGQRVRSRASPPLFSSPFPSSLRCPPLTRRPKLTTPKEALTYGCICGNGKQPNMTQYTLTLPYHTCTEHGTQCVNNCPAHDNECARACREDNPCGAQDPSASKPSATDDDDEDDEDEVFEGLAGSGDDDKGSAGRAEVGGLVVVLGALFAGAALL